MLSGFGLAMAYIVPIAMLQKWFPDKAGLITGIAVGGFGAVITSPVAGALIANDKAYPTAPFRILGIAYLIVGVLGALLFANPPKGYRPPGMARTGGDTHRERDRRPDRGARLPNRRHCVPRSGIC
ncbi:MFS transporter [Nostocoides australiense]